MTKTDKLIIAQYKATGRIVSIRKTRKSGTVISINGMSAIPVKTAIAKMSEFLAMMR